MQTEYKENRSEAFLNEYPNTRDAATLKCPRSCRHSKRPLHSYPQQTLTFNSSEENLCMPKNTKLLSTKAETGAFLLSLGTAAKLSCVYFS